VVLAVVTFVAIVRFITWVILLFARDTPD